MEDPNQGMQSPNSFVKKKKGFNYLIFNQLYVLHLIL